MTTVDIVSCYADITKIETRSYHCIFNQSKPNKESHVAVLKNVLIILIILIIFPDCRIKSLLMR